MCAHIFTQANPNTVYASIFENNMDDSSFDKLGKSLIKTVSLPRQALYGSHVAVSRVSAMYGTDCKVSLKNNIGMYHNIITYFNLIQYRP